MRRDSGVHAAGLASDLVRLALIGSLCFAGVACKKSAPGEGAETSEEAKQAHSLYVSGYNALLREPSSMVKEFFERVPEQGMPPGRRVNLFPRHNLAERSIKEAKEAFAKAGAIKADETAHFAPLADKIITSVEKALETFRAAHNYYSAEDYKDDKGAKGKQLYAAMKQTAGDYRRALDQMSDELSKIEDRETLAGIKQHEAKKGPSYWFRYYNYRAKKTLDALPDQARYSAAFAQLEQTYQDLETWKKSAGDALSKPGFKPYLNMADQFFNKAKALKRMLGEGDARKLQQQSSQLVTWYNNLINMGNSLYKMEAQGLL